MVSKAVLYLEAEHASQEGKKDSHSSNAIQHEGASAKLLDQKHLQGRERCGGDDRLTRKKGCCLLRLAYG